MKGISILVTQVYLTMAIYSTLRASAAANTGFTFRWSWCQKESLQRPLPFHLAYASFQKYGVRGTWKGPIVANRDGRWIWQKQGSKQHTGHVHFWWTWNQYLQFCSSFPFGVHTYYNLRHSSAKFFSHYSSPKPFSRKNVVQVSKPGQKAIFTFCRSSIPIFCISLWLFF